MNPEHKQKRKLACTRFLDKLKEFPDFMDYIIWTDEKYFVQEHTYNHHNDGHLMLDGVKPEFQDRVVPRQAFPKKVNSLSMIVQLHIQYFRL